MGQDNPFSFNWSPSYAPWFAPDTTTITDTSTIMGSNIQEGDGPIERNVLEKVGSYGYQINRIVDVLSILLKQATSHDGLLHDLTPRDVDFSHVPADDDARKSIEDFFHMASEAAKASEEYKEQATTLAVERLIKRMKRLKETDPKRYNRFKDKIEVSLRE